MALHNALMAATAGFSPLRGDGPQAGPQAPGAGLDFAWRTSGSLLKAGTHGAGAGDLEHMDAGRTLEIVHVRVSDALHRVCKGV